ncbi:unnamed protein product, partial [Ixodes persulcatus]
SCYIKEVQLNIPSRNLNPVFQVFADRHSPFLYVYILYIPAFCGVYTSSDNDIHSLSQQAHEDNFLHCKEEAPRIQIPHYRSWQDSIGTALRRHVQQFVSVYGSGCEGRRLLSVLLNCCCGSR